MIGVIDSKICNIFSLTNMLKKLKADFRIVTDDKGFDGVDKIILPGVGAFPKAMENLEKYNLKDMILERASAGMPVLGICLGMQLLFEESHEFGVTAGLGLIPGTVIKIKTDEVLPHMGWNDISILKDIPLLDGVHDGADVYFVHTFRGDTDDKYIAAQASYGEKIPAVVYNENVMGTQFHPEKSLRWGEVILNNFIGL